MSKRTLTVARATGWLFVAAALALTAGCGGGGKLESSSAFQYLPNDSTVIGSFRVDEIMKSQAYKDLMADQKVKTADPLKAMEKEVGLSAEDLERVVIAVGGGKDKDPVIVVTTKKPVTAADLTAKMTKKKFKEVKVGSFTMHENEDGEAFCVADKNTIVGGKTGVLKGILERNKKAELTAGMKQALALADESKPIFLAINAKGMAGDAKGMLPGPAAAHADKLEAVALNASLSNEAVVNLVAVCQDSAAAEAIHKEADANLKKAKEGLADITKEFPGMASLSKVLDTVKITASGNKVSGTVSVKPTAVLEAIEPLMGMKSQTTFEGVGKPIDPIEGKK